VTRLEKIYVGYPKARVIHIISDPRAVVGSVTIQGIDLIDPQIGKVRRCFERAAARGPDILSADYPR